MSADDRIARPPEWHALLAPLPADAHMRRRPILSPGAPQGAAGNSIAGWDQIVAELSAGGSPARVVVVTVDEANQLLSASDLFIYRSEVRDSGKTEVRHESIGGRFEPDGRFLGTRWVSTALEPVDGQQLDRDAVPDAASVADGVALRALAEDLLQRSRDLGPCGFQ